jgi:hypothetical protein
MSYQVPIDSGNTPPDPRAVLLADLTAQPDLNRHIAIAWARLAGHGRAAAANHVTVLRPFTL